MLIKSMCTVLALGQLIFFAAPVQAQGYYIPSPGTGGYYNGTGIYNPLAGYSPYTTGAQLGYRATSYGSPPSQALGIGVGLGMYGGMAAIGAVMIGSRMIANRNLYKNNAQNPNASNSDKKKDKQAKSERRRNQELKLKGQLDSDYQKELAEKGMAQPGQMPGATGFTPPGAGQGMPTAMNQASSAAAPSFGGSAPGAGQFQSPPASGAGSFGGGGGQSFNPAAGGGAGAAPESGQLNTPWSPDLVPPSF